MLIGACDPIRRTCHIFRLQANQLCTDDFTGRLANNTNLAAKGIVALEAFAHLCAATGGANCDQYSSAAAGFVATWTKEALEQDPKPHYKIAYNFANSCNPTPTPSLSLSLRIVEHCSVSIPRRPHLAMGHGVGSHTVMACRCGG